MPTSLQVPLAVSPWSLKEQWPTSCEATAWPLLPQGSVIPTDVHVLSSVPASLTVIPACRRATAELPSDTAAPSSEWARRPFFPKILSIYF